MSQKVSDGLLLVYTSFIILYSEIKNIPIKDTWIVEQFLYDIPDQYELVINFAILMLFSLLTTLFVVRIITIDTTSRVFDKQSPIFNLIIPLMKVVQLVQIPVLAIIAHTLSDLVDGLSTNNPYQAPTLVLTLLNLLLFSLISFVIRRLITLRVEFTKIAWSGTDQGDIFIENGIRMVQVTLYVILSRFPDSLTDYVPLLIGLYLIVAVLAAARRLMIPPMPNRAVGNIKKLIEWTNIAVLLTILLMHFG